MILHRRQLLLRASKLSRCRDTRSRWASTLTIIEHRNGEVSPASLNAITASTKIGGPVTAFIAGTGAESLAERVRKIAGVEKALHVSSQAYDKGLPESFAPLLVENIKRGSFTHVVGASSAFGKNVIPRVAVLLDVQQISDVIKIESEETFQRPIYAGNAIATVRSNDKVKIMTIRPTAFESAALEGGDATVEAGHDLETKIASEWVSEQLTKSERPDLSTAARVVSGGRGLKDRENFDKIMYPLADAMGAAIGASRAAVDAGYADNSLQVGQTGKVVAPEMYMAVGISGAIQHLAGMKDSKIIAAINKDGDAPIFQVADIGLVADLFKAVPELTDKVKKSA